MPAGEEAESPNRSVTASGSTPRPSATICANVVSCPWPCGPEPLYAITLPSGSIATRASSNWPPARSTYSATPVPTMRSASDERSGSTSSIARSMQRS